MRPFLETEVDTNSLLCQGKGEASAHSGVKHESKRKKIPNAHNYYISEFALGLFITESLLVTK